MDRFEDDVRAFVALVVARRSVEAIDRFYADDVQLYENYAAPRVGKVWALPVPSRSTPMTSTSAAARLPPLRAAAAAG